VRNLPYNIRMKKFLYAFVLVLIISVSFVILKTWIDGTNYKDQSETQLETQLETLNEDNTSGNDKDEHGCSGPEGYVWCEESKKCIKSTEESCLADDEAKLIRSLEGSVKSFVKSESEETRVYIMGLLEDHAYGSVFYGDVSPITNMWIAVKEGAKWQTVWNGTQEGLCVEIKKINDFPLDLVYECIELAPEEIVE